MPVHRVTTIDVQLKRGEHEFYITPFSDLHIDSRDFQFDAFLDFTKLRNELPKHRGILLGDVMDLVVPPDLRRWSASTQDANIIGKDAWLNEAVDLATERLVACGVKWDFISPGNHEVEFRRHHGVDVTSILSRSLKCQRGGYSGYIQYRIKLQVGGTNMNVGMFRIAYHHGAWGGRLLKGFGGARDWFRAFDGWNMALYAHNHQATVHREAKIRPARNGTVVHYPVYYVDCGSWVKSYTDDAQRTHYAERHGHMPNTLVSPLIRVRVTNHGGRKTLKGVRIDYTVEM